MQTGKLLYNYCTVYTSASFNTGCVTYIVFTSRAGTMQRIFYITAFILKSTSRILMNYSNELCKIMHAIRVLLNKPFECET